jgi:chemosensory pili system protein ChpA (sensor histidine kinase/response regulator)
MPPRGAVQEVGGRPVLQIGHETIEIKSLAHMLGEEGSPSAGPMPVVVVRTAQGVLGVAVDELLGRQEIVIKTLGALKLFQGSCYSGATIDPEGRVVLVVDVAGLLTGRRLGRTLPRPVSAEGGGPGVEREVARILLIDDSLSVRKFIGRMLEAAGYQVDTAADGEEGVRKALAAPYQLIMVDLEMPKINGYEVIQTLRGRPHTRATPIAVITTRAGEKHRQMAVNLGVTSYITKPVEERALLREIRRWVGGVAGARV